MILSLLIFDGSIQTIIIRGISIVRESIKPIVIGLNLINFFTFTLFIFLVISFIEEFFYICLVVRCIRLRRWRLGSWIISFIRWFVRIIVVVWSAYCWRFVGDCRVDQCCIFDHWVCWFMRGVIVILWIYFFRVVP